MAHGKTEIVYDALIVGGGPVGLFLACELGLAGCSVLVLEKAASRESPLKHLPFGIRGLSAPTVEAMDRRGLLNSFELHKRVKNPHATSQKENQPARQAGHFAGIPLLENDIQTSRWTYRLPTAAPTHLLSEMEELEVILARRAESLGVEILHDVEVTGIQPSADGVRVGSDRFEARGRWLIGCDGSRSRVRKAAGFDFVGTEPEFTGYSAKVEVLDPEKLKPGRNSTPHGMYLQSQPGYIVIQDFDGGAAHGAAGSLSLEHLQEVLRRVSGTDVTITKVLLATTWTDRSRQASSYRNGRILLAGDAAHIHSPLGGQGLNLGLGDAMNLGWKLAATIHDKAPRGLLDTYEAERHLVGKQVLDWSRAQVAVMKPTPEGRALNAILREVIATPDGATYFAGRVWGVATRYDLGLAVHPLIGGSVPNFALKNKKSLAELLRDGKGLLLDFDGRFADLARSYFAQVNYVAEAVDEPLDLRAVLVRPDGILAWAATESSSNEEDLKRALARWFTYSL